MVPEIIVQRTDSEFYDFVRKLAKFLASIFSQNVTKSLSQFHSYRPIKNIVKPGRDGYRSADRCCE